MRTALLAFALIAAVFLGAALATHVALGGGS